MEPAISDYNKCLSLLSVIQFSGGHCIYGCMAVELTVCSLKPYIKLLRIFSFLNTTLIKNSEVIMLRSPLTTFKVSNVFGASHVIGANNT